MIDIGKNENWHVQINAEVPVILVKNLLFYIHNVKLYYSALPNKLHLTQLNQFNYILQILVIFFLANSNNVSYDSRTAFKIIGETLWNISLPASSPFLV